VDVNAQFWVQPADGDNDSAVDLDGTSSIFAWGAQLEEVSGAWDSENLLLQSEDFLTTWLETNAASVANQTVAPDGTLTADKLIDDSSTGIGLVRLRQIVTTEVSTAYTYSMYLKADQLSWALLQCSGMGTQTLHMYVNLSTGTVGSVSGDVDDSGVENVGNGWYRCWIAFTSDAVDTSANFNIFPANVAGDINVDHDGTSSIFVWGAQLERKKPAQTGPGPYIQTTGVAITNYSPSSYIPTTTTAATSLLGTNDGLLIEEARTNRCLQSENLSSSWVNTASVDTQGETIAPDGSLTGNKLVDDGSTGTKDVRVAQSVTVATATAYTFSLFAKADQLDIVALQLFGFTTPGTSEAWFDLGAGTVGTVDAGFDNSGIEDYGNGWYRCWGSFTTDAADTTGTLHIVVC
jgi:hypothetical protein